MDDPSTRGWIEGAVATAVVGASFPVSAALAAFPPALGQAGRYLAGAAILVAVLRGRLVRPTARELARLAAVAAVGMAGFNLLLLAAVERIGGANTGVVVGASPVLLAVVAPLLARRRPAPALVGCAVVVTAGAALVTGVDGGADPGGLALAVAVLACEVLFTLLAAPLLPRLGPANVAAWAALVAAAELAVLAALAETPRAPTAEEAAALAYLATGTTALAFVCWFGAVQRLGAERAGLLVGLMPVAAVAADAVLYAATPTVADLTGTALVAAGVALGRAAPTTGRSELVHAGHGPPAPAAEGSGA